MQAAASDLLHWCVSGGGRIAIGHRPSRQALAQFPEFGATGVLTLLSEREGARDIGAVVSKRNMTWYWLPLENASPPEPNRFAEIRSTFDQLAQDLSAGAAIFVHCSAGQHRTGMFTFALLRYMGASPDAAKERMRELRPLTWEAVGQRRLSWSDEFLAHCGR